MSCRIQTHKLIKLHFFSALSYSGSLFSYHGLPDPVEISKNLSCVLGPNRTQLEYDSFKTPLSEVYFAQAPVLRNVLLVEFYGHICWRYATHSVTLLGFSQCTLKTLRSCNKDYFPCLTQHFLSLGDQRIYFLTKDLYHYPMEL